MMFKAAVAFVLSAAGAHGSIVPTVYENATKSKAGNTSWHAKPLRAVAVAAAAVRQHRAQAEVTPHTAALITSNTTVEQAHRQVTELEARAKALRAEAQKAAEIAKERSEAAAKAEQEQRDAEGEAKALEAKERAKKAAIAASTSMGNSSQHSKTAETALLSEAMRKLVAENHRLRQEKDELERKLKKSQVAQEKALFRRKLKNKLVAADRKLKVKTKKKNGNMH
jgi:hypothetical protein